MRLKTLLEYQRCYDMLRCADIYGKPLAGPDYVDVLRAKTMFDAEMAEHLTTNAEITNEIRHKD